MPGGAARPAFLVVRHLPLVLARHAHRLSAITIRHIAFGAPLGVPAGANRGGDHRMHVHAHVHRPDPGLSSWNGGRLARRPQRSARPRLPRRRAVRRRCCEKGIYATTRPSSSTATRTTGGRPTRSGCSSCSAIDERRVMDGGRAKWEDEGRPMTTDVPKYPRRLLAGARRRADPRLPRRGARAPQEERPAGRRAQPEEYSGEKLHMPEYPQEGALRGGHIPGAKSVPWARAVDPTPTFKSADRAAGDLRGGAGPEARRRRRLLPDRRALEPHLVRAHLPAR